MYLQLTAIVADLRAAERRLHALRDRLPPESWTRRSAPGRWTPAECVAHLNLTSEAFLPLLRAGLEEARQRGRTSGRYRRDVFGWLIWRAVTPSRRFRTKTPSPFVPDGTQPVDAILAGFDRLQQQVVACVRDAEGLPIDRVKIVSPFDGRVRYNVYAAMTIVPRHQHRHLLQAEEAAGSAEAARVS